jgi:hypothetical protein
MLEILLVIYLCKQIGNVLRNKGRSPGWYQAMLVAFWIIGELMGGIIAMVIMGGEANALAYLGALAGAAAGAGLAFFVAHQATPAAQMAPRGFAVMPYPSQRDPGEI